MKIKREYIRLRIGSGTVLICWKKDDAEQSPTCIHGTGKLNHTTCLKCSDAWLQGLAEYRKERQATIGKIHADGSRSWVIPHP